MVFARPSGAGSFFACSQVWGLACFPDWVLYFREVEEQAAFLFLHQTQRLTGDHHHIAVPAKGSQSESALSLLVTALPLRGDKL